MKRLQQLLEAYREGGTFPTYAQLAEIAYEAPVIRGHNPEFVIIDELNPVPFGDQNAPQTNSR